MPYKIDNPPERIKKLPKHAQSIWISAYNSAYKQHDKDEEVSNKIAWSAVKKIYEKDKDGKWVKKKNMSYSFPICLSDAKIKEKMNIHVIPIGEWKHDLYGDMKITDEDVKDFVKHFDDKIRKGVAITEGHQLSESPAMGWFEKLKFKNESGLWGTVKWTRKGRELLEEKSYKYFSPEFFSVYEDPETHRVYNNVLVGGALTNSPFFKELKSIVMTDRTILDQFNDEKIMSKEQEEKKLSEDKDTKETTEEETPEKKETTDKETEKDLSEKMTYRKEDKKSSEKIVYQIMNSGNIELSDKKDLSEFKKELLRTGTWQHNASKDGILEVTKDTLKNIVKNFEDKVLDNVYVPLGHPVSDDPSKNVGEVTGLTVEGKKLMATINVKVKDTVIKIKDKLIKGISASIAEDYMKKDTGEHVGPTLFHAALVSEPYIKNMAPFVPLSEDMKDSTIIPIMNMVKSLTLEELSSKIESLEDKIKNMSEETTQKSKTSEETPKEEETTEEETTKEETSTEETPKEETPEQEKTELGCAPCGDKAKETPAEEKVEKKAEETPAETPKEDTKKETVDEKSKEETSKEDDSKKDLSEEGTDETKESSEEETTEKETSGKEETESTDVGKKTEDVEEEETETEETKTEETTEEAEEAKEEVALAEAEKMYGNLLNLGVVTPAEREFVMPLLALDTEIELSEDQKVASGKALYEYLKKQAPKVPLSEEGTSETPKETTKTKKSKEIPEDVNNILDKMDLSEDVKKEVWEEFQAEKKGENTTSI